MNTGIGGNGQPSSVLQDIDYQVRGGAQVPEAAVRFLVGMAKLAHDMELPPTNFQGYVQLSADAHGNVSINLTGRVGGL